MTDREFMEWVVRQLEDIRAGRGGDFTKGDVFELAARVYDKGVADTVASYEGRGLCYCGEPGSPGHAPHGFAPPRMSKRRPTDG